MKKNSIYIILALIVGLVAGFLLFGGDATGDAHNKDNHKHSKEVATEQLWTCSMHPQIMQPEPGDCPICGMELIPAGSEADGLSANEIKMTKNAMALANIQTSVVGNSSGKSDNGISLSGKIVENEEANTVQASYFDGRIERLNINFEGQEVQKGQLLATIYSPDLVAAQQELLTTARLKESQPALYKSVRNKLKLWKLSESQIKRIEASGEVRENFPIYATVSGTVSEKMTSEGDYVKKGQPILKLNNLNTLWAAFDAYENQIAEFEEGQNIKITANAYPNKEFDATISFIDPVLNTQTRTVTVRATIKNKDNLLKPGMFVTGKVKVAEIAGEQQLLIPASAVMWTGERSLVYVKTNPNHPVFEMREVRLGNRNGENYSITSGLKDGDVIVTNGTFTVDAAAQLQGKKSMMNQPTAKEDVSKMQMELPETFQKDFTTVLATYFELKDAFVDSNIEQTKTLANNMFERLKSLKTFNLGAMEMQHLNKIESMLKAISKNDNIENQRDHFIVLSENIIAFASNMKNLDKPIYLQHCPMVNNNQGADWLSLSSEIKNPYYGEKMLNCGDTQREL
ncbi:efflux RND transporter periplasmic adaptor subunit [Haloflavibacter putidus]|uniref:Efflux RND transporter periplasmic adaptor subunit n=1 Tax=Haloflavibacter putidus TaxID=2576776 RepID=A0A507ZJF0_9FLAO|nr:efflux RND transporter periplasmic adaptor subunit [Haloflavibacter putidus]TQD36264.1 efflux RND transporter periplasmic adaptor subunit [Haloflavibacter putidus]